jgi:hypothetical protein
MITAARLSALLYPVGWEDVLLKVVPLGPGSNYFFRVIRTPINIREDGEIKL